ncbi:ubiquitin carboxyl-terminal hydrolase 32-like, partial [Protobothrops mucrosquamatus]|uniref:ubiquitin carboxyl-terminal hydrolase 32-like n=1 Tax=Protobothrops mucrosquamatus TaxID=103944 RepID=UPI000775B16D
EESDIIDLEKRYWLLKAQSRTGRFDLETFGLLVSPPIHPSLSEGLFNAFDENRDNHIDFKEISCGLSACCRGPLAERQKFCFKVFDVDRDGVLSKVELEEMVVALLEVWKDNRIDNIPELHMNLPDIVEDILKSHDTTKLGHLTLEDYQIWSVKSALANEFLNLLFQVCHIVLGLRPATPGDEGQIISLHSNPIPSAPEFVGKLRNILSATTPNAETCFARQLNSSDNNNQCLLASNGNILLQLLNPQRPGAIDNQPLVTQEPVK